MGQERDNEPLGAILALHAALPFNDMGAKLANSNAWEKPGIFH